jgi:hypothetical protein
MWMTGSEQQRCFVKMHPKEENLKYQPTEAKGSRNMPQSLNVMKNL